MFALGAADPAGGGGDPSAPAPAPTAPAAVTEGAAPSTPAPTPAPAPAGVSGEAAPPAAGSQPGAPGEAEGPVLVKLPELLELVEAPYPPQAEAAKLEGTVVLRLDVDAAGAVTSVTVVEPAGNGFDEAAAEAARRFRFRPAETAEGPVPVTITYRYGFVLRSAPAPAAGPARLKGLVLERGTRRPLAGVSVIVGTAGAEEEEQITDAEGRFESLLGEGMSRVTIQAPGYAPYDTTEQGKPGEEVTATYYVEKRTWSPYETTVTGKREKKEVSRRTIEMAEIRQIPGNTGDAIKVVENLPGVARSPFSGGMLIVRGAAPEDTQVFLNDHQIPLIYHFGGFRSIIPSDLLETLEFLPGGYSVRYGRALGGIIDAKTRKPKGDMLHGYADADFIDGEFLLEGPITKSGDTTMAGAFRRSYLDALLPMVLPDDAPTTFEAVPRYYDYQFLLSSKLDARNEVESMWYGSRDRMELVLNEPAQGAIDVRGRIQNRALFHRLRNSWKHRTTTGVTNELTVDGGWTQFVLDVGQAFNMDMRMWSLALRDDVSVEVSRFATLNFGADVTRHWWKATVTAPFPPKEGEVPQPVDSTQTLHIDRTDSFFLPAVYVEAVLKPTERWTVIPGLRTDYWHDGEDLSSVTVDPRLGTRFKLAEPTTLKGSVGLTHQMPQADELDDTFGNPALHTERALQTTVGVEQRVSEPLSLDVQGFWRWMDELVAATNDTDAKGQPLVLANDGVGRAYGLEVLLRHQASDRFFGWIAYTLSRSERLDGPGQHWRPFEWDQTHIFAALATYRLGGNWDIGARWRLVSGNLMTPMSPGPYDADADTYVGVPGVTNSDRLPPFHQLDLRLDKHFPFDRWMLHAYIDVQNAYYRSNPEFMEYSYDYRRSQYVTGIPILPSIGVRAEF